jgi:protein O-GlcNAc transferase
LEPTSPEGLVFHVATAAQCMTDTSDLRLALADHQSGRIDAAIPRYRRVLLRAPNTPDALYLMGMAMSGLRDPVTARQCFERAVLLRPNAAALHRELGNARRDTGDPMGARVALEASVRLGPEEPENHNALGLALRDFGDPVAALRAFETGLALRPDDSGLTYNRAMTLQLTGRLEDAIRGYDSVLDRQPGMLDARNNRAKALCDLGYLDRAVEDFRGLLALAPGHWAGWNNLGIALRGRGELKEAADCFERSLRIDPDNGEALNNLGTVVWALGDEKRAIDAYEHALAARPDLADASLNLAIAFSGLGRHRDAVSVFDSGAKKHPEDARFPIRRALSLPQVCLDTAEIAELRSNLIAFLDSDAAHGLRVDNPVLDVGSANFYWAYHGLDDRALYEKIAAFHRRCCPRLSWIAPHCRAGRPASGKRPRLGICSKYLNRHTIGLLFAGVIERMARTGAFEIVILRPAGWRDDVAGRIDAAADHVLHLPASFTGAQEAIAEARLDVLLYTDIGMEPITYFLAFSRLAPLQFVTWGHPVTTGLDSLDGYLSAGAFEPEEGNAHYSEGLHRLANILMHYEPPGVFRAASKDDFGLAATGAAYVCPQNIFKLHPDFDQWLAEILRADPAGQVVLIEGSQAGWTERLKTRLNRAIPDVVERITFLPFLPTQRYFELLTAADVILDPIHFGGGNTTFHALSLGTPLVTTPGAFQRSRFASGTCRSIGLEDLVAQDRADYVARAVALGRDHAHRHATSQRVRRNAGALHRRDEAADELRDFLLTAVEML